MILSSLFFFSLQNPPNLMVSNRLTFSLSNRQFSDALYEWNKREANKVFLNDRFFSKF